MSIYYVTSPPWAIWLRKRCERVISWTKRFDRYFEYNQTEHGETLRREVFFDSRGVKK